jgi:hypothetical protein
MGRSNKYLNPIYQKLFPKKSPIALLGFQSIPDIIIDKKNIDLYDLNLNNFDINSDWKLDKKYKSIICTRCLYFCKNPINFFRKCKEYLLEGGEIFVDYGLGHHWTKFKNFKVGWVKNGEHEWEYKKDNYLWSTLWDNYFLENSQVKLFQERIKKFGYKCLNKAVEDEVPKILKISDIKELFKKVDINFLALWEDMPQLYIFLNLTI